MQALRQCTQAVAYYTGAAWEDIAHNAPFSRNDTRLFI